MSAHVNAQPCSVVVAVQVVVTGCWLTVKEASLLLGSLVREAPVAKVGAKGESLFEAQQLTEFGEQLIARTWASSSTMGPLRRRRPAS